MFTCAQCAIEACRSGKLDQMPKNCPMHDPAFFEQVLEEYFKPENHDFFVASAAVEAIGYGQWPRLREVMEFARRMGYTKLGLAFCAGLHKEAAVVDRIFRKNGFEVVSVICKTGSIPKDRAGVPQQFRVRPGAYEVMCNPIAQAELLPQAFAYKILKKLEKAGLLEILRGTAGGCRLAADLSRTSLYDLMTAIGEHSSLSACMEPGYDCSWRSSHGGCGVHCKLGEIQRKLDAELRSHSLWELLTDP